MQKMVTSGHIEASKVCNYAMGGKTCEEEEE
jgi:hypothetical protein